MAERIAFKMVLNPGAAAEYRCRHDAIWPEICELLRSAGVSGYSIFLDHETHTLFAVLTRAEDHAMDELAAAPAMRRWWDHMRDIMATRSDGTPKQTPLEPMFHMD